LNDEIAEIKREKRRLNDLMTLREQEIEKQKADIIEKEGREKEKDSLVSDLERKLKHLEKKYEKNVAKLS